MEYISLNYGFSIINCIKKSFILKLNQFKEIWLFNAYDGCQQFILQHDIKINQINKIIITDLKIDTIAGLLGIFSSLNLSNRNKPLHIYGPSGLAEYIDLGKKYSHTNFCYNIYMHVLTTGLIIDHSHYKIYVMIRSSFYELSILSHEKFGKFELNKATNFYLISGPLYGKLKQNFSFILPDGSIINGNDFTNSNYIGLKKNLFINKYHIRQSVESSKNSNKVIYEF
uniref:Ribonuclease Z n=1 Tax=Centroceras clavulatum TaxID=159503 RepID=A0A4D6WUB9_9FLOR|nr:ribonuclease Z [Centroceras clavulatum]